MNSNSEKLVNSSVITREWLDRIKEIIREKDSNIITREKEHYATFSTTKKAIAQLHVQKSLIRIFVRIDVEDHPELAPAPTTKGWDKSFPSVFYLRKEEDIPIACDIILKSLDFCREE